MSLVARFHREHLCIRRDRDVVCACFCLRFSESMNILARNRTRPLLSFICSFNSSSAAALDCNRCSYTFTRNWMAPQQFHNVCRQTAFRFNNSHWAEHCSITQAKNVRRTLTHGNLSEKSKANANITTHLRRNNRMQAYNSSGLFIESN